MTDMSLPPQQMVRGISINADLSAPGPVYIDGCDTLPKLFHKRAQQWADRVAMREKDLGIWNALSWAEYYDHARAVGLGLVALGVRPGDVISILSDDNKEWLFADLGAQCIGAIASGIYPTDSASQLVYLINDSGSKVLFVENDEQLDKFLSVRDRMPGLEKVVVFDPDGLHDFTDPQVMFIEALYELGRKAHAEDAQAFERMIAATRPEDVGVMVYTSGTTGQPKGGMVTHRNAMFNTAAQLHLIPVEPGDEQICFLPLCHIFERFQSGFNPIALGTVINFAESPETVFDNMREVSPHIFGAVPRFWEKIYSRVAIMASEATGVGRWAWATALRVGGRRADALLSGQSVPVLTRMAYAFWDFVLFSNLRRMLGLGRMRRAGSGAAPIAPELLRWYWSIGVPIFEGYGMTESAGVISVNSFAANRVGSVGKPLPGGEVRIAPDGEIQYRGGNVFKGYWNKPEKTAETMTADGWLRTGDIGRIEDGYLYITGRLKDIIITAGGKNITPAEIENKLKFSPYISDAVVIGDRRPYLTALIMIDQENVEKFAQDQRVPFNDFASLCRAPQVVELIRGVIEEVNKEFARVETIKDFRLIDILLTPEDEELTATMKLKRGFVEKNHKALIDQMYR